MAQKVEYVYTKIPIDYVCVYHTILTLMAEYGQDMLKDCKTRCADRSENILDCYNMFNSAIAANRIGETKLAETIIKYVKAKIKQISGIDCDNISFKFNIGENSEVPVIITTVNGQISIEVVTSMLFYYFTYNNEKLLCYVPTNLNPYTGKRFAQIFLMDDTDDYYLCVESDTSGNQDIVVKQIQGIDSETINRELNKNGFSAMTRGIYKQDVNSVYVHNGDFHEVQNDSYTLDEIKEVEITDINNIKF